MSLLKPEQAGRLAVALPLGVFVPLLGYSWCLSVLPPIGWQFPLWVKLSIPFAILGPDVPSSVEFWLLALLNVIAWGATIYGVMLGAQRFRLIIRRHA